MSAFSILPPCAEFPMQSDMDGGLKDDASDEVWRSQAAGIWDLWDEVDSQRCDNAGYWRTRSLAAHSWELHQVYDCRLECTMRLFSQEAKGPE